MLVFTIEHPIFMAAASPHWLLDEDGPRPDRSTATPSRESVRTDWFAKGVLKYHRTLAIILNTLLDSGFELLRVEEFAPTREQVEQTPGFHFRMSQQSLEL